MEEAHFYRRAKPGDTLEMEAEMLRLRAPLAVFKGSVKLHGERLAQIEHLVLAFGQEVVEHLEKREKEEETKDEAVLPVQTSVAPLPAPPAVSPAKTGKSATPAKTVAP